MQPARGCRPWLVVSGLLLVTSALTGAACRPQPLAPVVILSIDTLRSDRLPAYGYRDVETPAIDSLVPHAIRFERAYAHVPLTLPSHVSILSGQLPTAHGVRDNAGFRFDPTAAPWLPRDLQKRGYATGAVVSAWVLRGAGGFETGFDRFDDDIPWRDGAGLGAMARPGRESAAAAVRWLRAVGDRPFFLFFHVYEPHAPYQPPPPWPATYEGEIAAADEAIGVVLDELRRMGAFDRALIVLLSDHGEGLGEHGELEHGVLVYREVLQVPLLVKLPRGQRGGETISTPVGLTEVYPMVADALGWPDSRSALRRDPEPEPIYAETYYPRLHFGWSELLSVIEGDHHYIAGARSELFDLERDPQERRDLAPADRRLAAHFADYLDQMASEPTGVGPVDAETQARLAALGYLAGGKVASQAGRPDPRDHMGILPALNRGVLALQRGDLARAEHLLRDLVAHDPGLIEAWDHLGRALQAQRRFPAARAAYARCYALSGGSHTFALSVAAMDVESGAYGAAEAALETLLSAPAATEMDFSIVRELALRLSAAGRARPAERLLVRAADVGPGEARADTLEELSLVRLDAQNWPGARDAALAALALDPALVMAWNHLGVALYELDDRPGAVAAWQRAVALDPSPSSEAAHNLRVVSEPQAAPER